jgi:hypothetical protein
MLKTSQKTFTRFQTGRFPLYSSILRDKIASGFAALAYKTFSATLANTLQSLRKHQ